MRVRYTCARGVALAAVAGMTWALFALPSACSAPDAGARVDPIGPSAEQFRAVAPMLVRRCGSLDCHGTRYRNLRIYGYGGLRVDASPDSPKRVTAEEAALTYASVVGLEPEIMRDVVRSGGAGPERLTLVRKGREEEAHKGAKRITKGDDADRCLVSWLQGNVAVDACDRSGCVVGRGEIEGGQISGCEGPQ